MSKYINLNRIEFVITGTCNGRCKHCSVDNERVANDGGINKDAAVNAVKKLAKKYSIDSVMTFGGEPLLYADTVCEIHAAARHCGISKRQLITNGYFSKDESRIKEVARSLCEAGVSDILLSIDAFHQEFIPLEPVIIFAEAILEYGEMSLQVHPAWVVNENNENPYNEETKRLLKIFTDKSISASDGNNIFPSGAALKHLGEYFSPPEKIDLSVLCGSLPYTSRLDEIDCFGINPNGDVRLCSISIGNIYNSDILEIVENYNPFKNPATKALLDGGINALLCYAEEQGINTDISDCRSACGVCRRIMTALEKEQS
ncbi:MAG: radical SAM protein [Oscillospiraceae bacterium]|nr:radical SAM protein [Oscillospiraceae bacterium]